MDDLEKQLEEYGARAADEVEPVTAEQARDRAAAGGGGVADVVGSGVVTSGSEGSAEVVLAELDGERRSRWHTVLAVAAVVLVLALVGGALALRDDEPNDLVTEPAPSDDPTFGYGPGWHDLDPGPLSGRTGVAVAWTGTELIVVGGTTVDRSGEPQVLRDGAAYDPATRTWRSIPALPARGAPGDGPEAGGARLEAIWTGTEMLVVEISALSLASRPRGNARYVAAFDPATDTWRVTASWTEGELMSVGAADFALHWTGSEVLFADALVAYDPATDEFRELTTPADRDSEATGQDETWFELLVPEHPRRSVWTGDELLLFDAYATDGGVTIAIDPDTLERRRLEPRPGIPPAPSRPVDNIGDAVWTGSSLVDVNARGDEVATFDPSSEGGWRLGELPAASTPCGPITHVVAARVVVDRCDALFESVGDGWVRIGDGRPAPGSAQVSTGDVILEWTGYELDELPNDSRPTLRIWVPDAAVPSTTADTSPDVTGSVPTSESTTTSQVLPPTTAVIPPPSAPEGPAPVEWEWYGLTEDEAIAKAEDEGREWRMACPEVDEDPEIGCGLPADLWPGRITFTVLDGMVAFATIETETGPAIHEGVEHLEDTPYLGRTEAQAEAAARQDGWTLRVILRDGVPQDLDDARSDRLNLTVVDDRVVAVQRF